jgi:two-component system LytT family response regulator
MKQNTMSKYTALIVDDESGNRGLLKMLLEDHCPDVEVVGEADGVNSGYDLVEDLDPDILFLDIKMPDGDGFQLLEKYNEPRFQLIFVTAYDQYAIRSFKYSAVDYLLKPIDYEDLIQAVSRARERIDKGIFGHKIRALIENIRQQELGPKKLMVPDQQGFEVLQTQNVIRIEAEGNYSSIKLVSKKEILASKAIKFFEELLKDDSFYRIHNSHIVNTNHVVKYVRGRGGYVIMSDGAELEVSRRRREGFFRKMGWSY